MAYIGRGTDKLSNIEKLDTITFDGSSSYTLQKNSVNFTPNSANSLQVSIDGVVQAGNFTVSGSTIDFGVAIPATSTNDFIFHYGTGLVTTVADSAITTAKLADSSVSLAKLSATGTKDATTFLRGDNTFAEVPAGGITEADQWRITANVTNSGPTDITANWERNDTDFSYIGTGMTESSGVFTFPSTGIWLIILTINYQLNATSSYTGGYAYITTDNSTYNVRLHSMNTPANGHFGSIHGDLIFDVTDVTTHKFILRSESENSITVQGSTSRQRTGATFIRLGDT